jgi:hypothetical protein
MAWRIVRVNFNTEHKAMLGHCKTILESEGRRIAINPDRFDKLITALRAAVDNDGTLDKESTSHNDIFDAFRLASKFYRYADSSRNIIDIKLILTQIMESPNGSMHHNMDLA